MSPHEMKSARIEQLIENMERDILDPTIDRWYRSYYEGRVESFRAILKERANNGTYATAGI